MDNKAVIRRLFDEVLNAGTLTGMDLYRLENGQIVEHWHNVDELGLLR